MRLKLHTNETLRRAPKLPQVEHTDSSTQSLVDVDSPHVSSIPSEYSSQSIKTYSTSERTEQDTTHDVKTTPRKMEHEANQTKEHIDSAANRTDEKSYPTNKVAKKSTENPVITTNAIILIVIGSLSGWGAYKKYTAGELTWKVAGAWAGIVGLFAAGNYYISQ